MENNLQDHMLTHTGDLPYKCQKYEKAFLTPSWLRSLERKHNERNSIKISTVEKPLKVLKMLQYMKEFIGRETL